LAYERRKQGCTGCDLVTTEVEDFLFNDFACCGRLEIRQLKVHC
jgi:hypothetical protein